MMQIFTIGHSTHPLATFLGLLEQHAVTVVADVRSAPYSRFNPQFNKDELTIGLKAHGIKYVFMGDALGARSKQASDYVHGQVRYERLARSEQFQRGIERVMRGAESHRIALMCAEKEPLECHRTLLVARALREKGAEVTHILDDNSLETHEHAMGRLLEMTGVPSSDLFRSHDELISEAVARQERKIAYVDENAAAESQDNRL